MAMKMLRGRSAVKVVAQAQGPRATAVPKKATAAASVASVVLVAPAATAATAAEGGDSVDSAISTLVDAVKASGGILRSGISAFNTALDAVEDGYEAASPYIQETVKSAAPIAKQAGEAISEAAKPLINQASPYVEEVSKTVTSRLNDPAVSGVVSTGKSAVSAATPAAEKLAAFLTTSSPVVLAEVGAVTVAAYYLAGPLFGLFVGALRGYAGEVSAAQVLDSMAEGNCVLVDIRSAREKDAGGVPDMPGSMSRRSMEVEFAVTEDRRLRGALRNPTAIEAAVTALQIASLKIVSRGNKIFIMDKNGGQATAVAKELAAKGFGKVYVMAGGFDGRGGWVQSKLQIKPSATAMSAAPTKIGTLGNRLGLPAPKA